MVKKYLKTGVGLLGVNVLVGSIPNLSETTGESNIKTKFAEGTSKMGTALPVMGKVTGTKMVLKPIIKLKKVTGKFKMKGGYEL